MKNHQRKRKIWRAIGTSCEALESRRLLSNVFWTGGGDQVEWTDPKNWSNDALPGPNDDVTIDIASNSSINLASGSVFIHSLVCDDKLLISASATLFVSTTATFGSNASEDNTLRGLDLAGGTLLGGTYSFDSGSQTTLNAYTGNSTLNDVTIAAGTVIANSNFPSNNGSLAIIGGLNLNGTLNILSSGAVNFGDATHAAGTLSGNAQVNFLGSGAELINNSRLTGADATLTIASTVNLVFNQGAIVNSFSTGNILNQGVVQEKAGTVNSITLGGSSGTFTNQTSFQFGQMTGDTILLQNFINIPSSTITMQGPGVTLTFTGSLSNLGTINVTNVDVVLAGDFSQDDMGTFNRSGGTVSVTGTLEGDLNLDSSTGSWDIAGTINGGTVTTSDGQGLVFGAPIGGASGGGSTGGMAILNDITINGDLNLEGGSVTVEHSLTIGGTLTLGNASGTSGAELLLGTGFLALNKTAPFFINSPVTLTAANIVFGASNGNLILDDTLQEMAPPGPNDPPASDIFVDSNDITHYYGGGLVTINGPIQGGSGYITNEFSYGTITIKDGVTANGAGSVMVLGGTDLVGVAKNKLMNNGTMQAIFGGSLVLRGLANSGTVSASNNSLLEFTDSIANGGSITATNSTVTLDGTFTQSDLGNFSTPGSMVVLSGTLNGGLTLNAATGSWFLESGTVNGGTISESGGAKLEFTIYGGTLDGVTFDGDMHLDGDVSVSLQSDAQLHILGGLTLNGTMYLGNTLSTSFGELFFGNNVRAPGTLGGNASVVFGSAGSFGSGLINAWQGVGAAPLTIGPGISLSGDNGSIQSFGSNPIIFQGSINANVPGGTIVVGNGGPVINQGTIQATNGGIVDANNLTNAVGATVTATGSTLTLAGTLLNLGVIAATNSTVNLGANFSQALLGNFARSGGIVNITGILSGGLALNEATGSWVLNGGTIQSGAVNLNNGTSLIIGGLGGILSGLTVNGNIDGGELPGGTVTIFGGLVLNGTMTLANSSVLEFGNFNHPAGALTGDATILMKPFSAIFNGTQIANQTFTIGPDITIHGNGGTLGNNVGTATILIEGKINADTAGGTIQLGNGTGNVIDQGALQANDGGITFAAPFSLNGQGTLSMNYAGTISVLGNSFGGNTTASSLSSPAGVITFDGASNPQLLEVMGQDDGDTAAGFKNNFAYGTIIVATPDVKLVDNSDNAPGSAPEALYVNSIVVRSFETLDLNGLHVYARAVEIDGAASVINGTITQLPDGGALDINSPLPGAINPVGNVDHWTFFGRAGQVVTVYVNPGTGAVPAPISPNLNWAAVTLLDPNNQLVATNSSTDFGTGVALTNITLPSDGTYTIQIGAAAIRSSSVGNYVVAVFDVTPRIAPVNLAQNTFGSIITPFDEQQWTFTALAGEQVQFHLLNETSTNLQYTLVGPNGFTGFTNITGDSSLVDLPANGTYTLLVDGANGATGDYSFVINPTTQTSIPLNGSVNATLAGPGQAELYTISVPSVQALLVQLNDSTPGDSNELYLSFGTPPTPQNYDYRYSLADSASQSILVPSAAIGTWYALVYSDNVPAPSAVTISAHGYLVRLTGSTPSALGNSAPETLVLTGAGFEPGTTATLLGPGGSHIAATSTSVVSFTQLIATFPAGIAAGNYAIEVNSSQGTDTLNSALAITSGGIAHLTTGLQMPSQLGRHTAATIYVTYTNDGTVAMPAPLLVLGSTDPKQIPLMTLDPTKINQGLWTNTIPASYSTTIQILASGSVPGVLEPGESITIPIYYAGLEQPWDTTDTSVPMNLGLIDASSTQAVDWSSMKASLQPAGVSNAAWNQVYSNLTAQLGNTWGQFVTALDKNVSYLGSLGEDVTDFNTLWGFMYSQANDALGPVEHLQTVFDASLALPNGGTLSFWRNYHLDITDRYTAGMLGNGWSVPYQSSLQVELSGDVVLHTVGEEDETFQRDTRGGYFESDDGNSLTANSDGTYSITGADGESDTYAATGPLLYHSDALGNRINFGYDGSGRLISLTASTGQSITLTYNAAGLLSKLTTSAGDVTTYGYDPTNQFLTSVTSVEGTTTYTYNQSADELTNIQNADGSFTQLTYDALGRLQTLASQTASLTLSYEEPGEISGTDALNRTSHQFYNENGQVLRTIDASGNPTYFSYDSQGNVVSIGDAVGDTFKYKYDGNGNITSITNPLGYITQFTYTAQNDLASYTDANDNTTQLSYDALGDLSQITYPDGTQEQFAINALGETTSLTQRDGQAINYTYDNDGNVTQETFADGTQYDYTYDAYGELLTATDSNGTTTFTYTLQGSLKSVTYPDGTSLTYAYNTSGQLSQRVDQSGYTLNYVYDSAGRPSELVDGSNQPIVQYTYDAVGDLTRQDNANGTYTTYQYDADGNITHLINFAPGGTVNSRFDSTYNLINQLTVMTTLDGTWNYSYDAAGQLTRAIFTSTNPNISNQDLAYTYDPVGNRISTVINGVTTDYTVNSMDEYTSIGGVLQQYDANGNLISDGTTTFTYNPLNELTGFSNAQGSSQFTYNALSERVNSTVNGVFTEFLNDPNGTGTPTAEYGSGGQLITHFNQGVGIASQTTASGVSYFYDVDPTGSVAGLTNSSGAYVNTYSYLPFGQLLASSGTVANPFEFSGNYLVQTDAPNLVGMGMREYSPSAGAFQSTDPLQIAGGNWNFYTFAYNQPLQLVDPSGLKPLDPHAGEPWTIAHGIPIVPPQTIFNAMGGASAFKTDSFPAEPPSDWDAAKEAGGPLTETIDDALKIIVEDQRLPTQEEILDALQDHAFDALNKGPLAVFQVGTILKMLCDPVMAVNIGNGILGVERSQLCGTINGYEAAALVAIGEATAGCEMAPGIFGPVVPAGAGVSAHSGIASAFDPNDKVGPGFGAQGFVAAGSILPYRIDFENDSSANAPAQQVTVTDSLSSDLDWSSFRITSVGFGNTVVTVPPNEQHFQTTVSMTFDSVTFDVLIQIGINPATGLITANFFSIDPATQLPPSVLIGFLPPEDGTGRGMGYITYTVQPKSNLPTGTQIRNVANVSFDEEQIVATDQVNDDDPTLGVSSSKQALVTIDSVAPSSSVSALPATEPATSFLVSWSGEDDAGGSGIASYTIFVSDNGGAFTPWLITANTSATYSGAVDHTYAFYSVATDNVGNVEAVPMTADAETSVHTGVDILSATFAVSPSAQITVHFANPAAVNAADAHITLINGSPIVASSVNYNSSTNTAIYHFSTAFSNGIYLVQINLSGQTDSLGNPTAFAFDFLLVQNSSTFMLPGSGQTYTIAQLLMGSNSRLDISNNTLVVSYTPGNSPAPAVGALIASGYNNGNWTGPGIFSSVAAADTHFTTGVGYFDNGSAVKIADAWDGDTNLDGQINSDDLSLMMLGQAQHGTRWQDGNFNYDAQVNADDWMKLAYALAYFQGPLLLTFASNISIQNNETTVVAGRGMVASPTFAMKPIVPDDYLSDLLDAGKSVLN